MADFAQRSDFEAALARKLGKAQQELYQMTLDTLGDTPDFSKLTPEFWDKIGAGYGAAIQTLLADTVLEYVKQRIEEQSIGIEWATINERAAQWAREYTFELVKGITDNTRNALREQIEGFFRDGRPLSELQDSIAGLFGPVRAGMIAVTETTRAASEGEALFEEELRTLGLETTQLWQTANDDRVCEICEPLNQTARGDGWDEAPPAHVNCRCWTTTEVVKA